MSASEQASILQPLKTQTLRDSILQSLTDAILSNRIMPGERLNESQLARELEVSRGPIREALLQLQEQGLVLNSPRRGMFVVQLSEEDKHKINSVRLVLEAEALRLVRAHLTPKGRKELEGWIEKMERAQALPISEVARLDFEFHRTIWRLTGNEYLEDTLSRLTSKLFMYYRVALARDKKHQGLLAHHRPLIDFVFGNLDQSAEEVLLTHFKPSWIVSERYSSFAFLAKQAEIVSEVARAEEIHPG